MTEQTWIKSPGGVFVPVDKIAAIRPTRRGVEGDIPGTDPVPFDSAGQVFDRMMAGLSETDY